MSFSPNLPFAPRRQLESRARWTISALAALLLTVLASHQAVAQNAGLSSNGLGIQIDETLSDESGRLLPQAFSLSSPSADAQIVDLSIDDLRIVLSARGQSSALVAGQALSDRGRVDLAIPLLSRAIHDYPDITALRNIRMRSALQSGASDIAVADAIALLQAATAQGMPAAEDMDQPTGDLGLEFLTFLAGLVRDENWAAIEHVRSFNFDDPVYNFVARGIWTWATIDNGSQPEQLARLDEAFNVREFDAERQFLLGLHLMRLQRWADAVDAFAFALNSDMQGVLRPAIWASRTAKLGDDSNLAAQLDDGILANAQRSATSLQIAQLELGLSNREPTKKEAIVETLMAVSWYFNALGISELAKQMADLAWIASGDTQRVSTQLVLLRSALASQDTEQLALLTLADLTAWPSLRHTMTREIMDTLTALGEDQRARELVDALIAQDLDDFGSPSPASLAIKGSMEVRQRDFAEAIESYTLWEQTLASTGQSAISGDWLNYFRWAIAIYWNQGSVGMEPLIDRALELNPNNPFASNFLAYSWVDQGINIDQGLELLEQAERLEPQSAAIIDSVAWAYYRKGEFATALERLERAWNIESSSWEIADHLGDTYWHLDRRTEAVWFWNRALLMENLPDDEIDLIKSKIDGLAQPVVNPNSQ